MKRIQDSSTYIVGPFSCIVEPVGSWKDGQIIFKYIKSQSKMLSYDPCSQKTRYFSVPDGSYMTLAFNYIVNYVESLEAVDRCTSGRGYSRIHVQNVNPVDLEDCSNDFVSNFAIPGPKGSHFCHCKLCGEGFSSRNDTLKLHLAHLGHRGSPYVSPQSEFCPPCPYVSDYVKKHVKMYLPLSNDDISRNIVWVLKKKLIIKRGFRGKLVGNFSGTQDNDNKSG